MKQESHEFIRGSVKDKEVQKQIKQLGYKGCKNCQHQIAPLRMCKWAEQGGDGRIHLICPKWDKKGEEEMTDYKKYINALRKCAKERENDRTLTGSIVVSALCKDTANLLEELEQEPRKDEVILTKEEYGELVSSEFDNGYAKGYREALEQEPILDKIRAEIEKWHKDGTNWSDIRLMEIEDILDKEQGRK